MQVGVKFCGNCNPHVSTREIFKEIKQLCRKEAANVEFVSWETAGIKKLLVLCGCPANCATRPPGKFEEVIVAGQSVNQEICSEESIPLKVLETMQNKNAWGDDARK
jgi:hypothetical protein